MTDETRVPTIEDHIKEHAYHTAMLQHSHDFGAFISSIPEEHSQIRETVERMFSTKPDKLLDPEKMQELKQKDLALFGEVSTHYTNYLEKSLGLD